MASRSADDAILHAGGPGAEAAGGIAAEETVGLGEEAAGGRAEAAAGLAAGPGPGLRAEATVGQAAGGSDTGLAVAAIYAAHYRSLVGLAALLVRDMATAEEVVQDSFAAMHGAWRRLRDSEKALSYLRQSVVNRSRSLLRHRAVAGQNAPEPAPAAASAEQGAITLLERSAVISALRALPARQREALVLKYYADLSEAQVAAAMGITHGAVQSHLARAMAVLQHALDP